MKHRKSVSFSHVIKDIGHTLKPVGKEVEHVVNKAVDLPSHIVDKAAGVANNMSLPLLVIGGAVVIYLINKK